MAKKIVWNKRAINNLDQIIEYLQKEWNDEVTGRFVVRVYTVIDLIAQYPEIETIEVKDKNIRGFVITKHSTLFYRVDDDRIIVLSVFDNRQHPKKKTLIL